MLMMILGAVLLRFFGDTPEASWPVLFLDVFHLATTERVEPTGRVMPVILAFILPIGSALILGEGILRVIRIYLQRDANRKDWDMMVIKAYRDHAIICGVGEMGRQIAHRLLAEQPGLSLVLIDPRPGILAELGLSDEQAIHFQGDMTSVETLNLANILVARQAILTAGNDSVNLETAYKIQQINPTLVDWMRDPIPLSAAQDFLELFDDRYGHTSTIISSQVPISEWHARFPDPTLADAVLDRIVHSAYQLNLLGDSQRKIRGFRSMSHT